MKGESNSPVVQKNKVNSNLMYELNAYNVKPISGINSWRGSVSDLKNSDLDILRKAGIKIIVPLASVNFTEETCNKYGLNYFDFCVDSAIFTNVAFVSEDEIRENEFYKAEMLGRKPDIESAVTRWKEDKNFFIDEFVKFIQVMQQDNVYIGCLFGTNTTNNALMLNHFFNPKAQDTKPCIDNFNRYYVGELLILAQNLTPKHKKAMGWTKEFEEKTIAELKKYSDL